MSTLSFGDICKSCRTGKRNDLFTNGRSSSCSFWCRPQTLFCAEYGLVIYYRRASSFLCKSGSGSEGKVRLEKFLMSLDSCGCICFHRYLAMGSNDSLASLWDTKEWYCVRTFTKSEWVEVLCFSICADTGNFELTVHLF